MKHTFAPLSVALLWGALSSSLSVSAADTPNRAIPAVDPAKAARVDQALPVRANATPAKARRLLVSSRTEGYYHESIPVGLYAMQALGLKTGAFTVEFNHEMSAFDAANLARFDGVLLLSPTQLKFSNPAHREALLDFIRTQGKGLIGIHAAADNFYEWPEGQALLGGVFHSHPWLSRDTVAVRLDEPSHPLVQAFGGRGFWVRDEIYQIVGPYGRDKQRVVLSLDMSKAENKRPAEAIARTDNDFPIAWAKMEGSGRVFFSSLGHNDEIYYDSAILAHYLDGIQFALGDLTVPTEPSSKVGGGSAPALAPAAPPLTGLDSGHAQALLLIGENEEPGLVRAAEAALARASWSQKSAFFASLSNSPTRPSAAAQRVVAALIARYGSHEQIPLLAQWAGAEVPSEAAVQTLGIIGGKGAFEALGKLLAKEAYPLEIAAINAAGAARAETLVPALVKRLGSADAERRAAAGDALARIANAEALQALVAQAKSGDLNVVWSVLAAAERASAVPLPERLAAVNAWLGDGRAPVRIQALDTLLALDPEAGVSVALPLLEQADLAAKLTASVVKAAAGSPARAETLAARLGQYPADTQQRILSAAEQLASPALRAVALAGVKSAAPENRSLALLALAASGQNLADAEPLFGALAAAETRAAAVQALSRARIENLDTVLRGRAAEAPDAVSLASYLTICSNRADSAVMPLVLKHARSEQAEVRAAAYKALAPLVRGEDLDTLFGLREGLRTAVERRAWQDATVNAIRFRNDTEAVSRLLADKLPSAVAFERTTYAVALVNLNTPIAIAAVQKEFADPDLERRKEIIRALSSARILPSGLLLISAAEKAADASERILALRGFLDFLLANPELPIEDRVAYYKRAWAVAERREEQGAIVAIAPSLWNPEGRRFGAEIVEKFRSQK